MKRVALLIAAVLSFAAGSAHAAATPSEIEALYLQAVELMTDGRHEEATAAFERLIAREPLHAGAWLELAISQCTLGRTFEAEKLFREIEVRFAPSAGILDVIDSHRRSGCKPWTARSYRSVALSVGADSNVNQGASNPVFATGSGPDRIEGLLSEDFRPRRDQFVQGAFEYSRELTPQRTTLFSQMRMRRHDEVRAQDTNALLLGVDHPMRAGAWTGHAMFSTSFITLAGSLYQRQFQVQGRITPPFKLPKHLELTLAASFGRAEYVTRRRYDADTGELSATLNYRTRHDYAQLATGALDEHGERERLGGNRRGWYASLQWQHKFGDRLGGELGLTRQDWDSARVYAPNIVDQVRKQSTRQARVALVRPLSAKQSVVLEYRHVYNRENISLFQYNSDALQLYWRWNGF